MVVLAMYTHCSLCRVELEVVWESLDRIDQVYVAELRCPLCDRHYLDSRRPDQQRPRTPLPSTTKGQKRMAKAKSQDLPGMEDRSIPELEAVAVAYADIRDRRIVLNHEESELKKTTLSLMAKHQKQIYIRGEVDIRVTEGEPDVKVRVKKPKDESEDAEGTGPEAGA
jgi:hypothetical protein